jgi:hypothetical protein
MTLRGVGHETLALTSDILVKVVTRLVETKVLPPLPATLHHFTSLETAYRIIDGDNIRLSHAEYSNDQREMAEAKEIICSELTRRSSNPFFGQVLLDYAGARCLHLLYVERDTGYAKPVAGVRSGWSRRMFNLECSQGEPIGLEHAEFPHKPRHLRQGRPGTICWRYT